eukprot:c19838_g1_i4.p1 GENE.c19838_g1_i4~~c19838_g1_i4.p1  ORF type:complete len:110 (-),score=22.23 c19838_g1_i4:386-715(-)
MLRHATPSRATPCHPLNKNKNTKRENHKQKGIQTASDQAHATPRNTLKQKRRQKAENQANRKARDKHWNEVARNKKPKPNIEQQKCKLGQQTSQSPKASSDWHTKHQNY